MRKKRRIWGDLVRLVLVTLIGFQVGTSFAENNEGGPAPRPWVNKPSPALAARLQHWHFKFEPGRSVDAPEKGAFPSLVQNGTVRLVSDRGSSAPFRLSPVRRRTRYVPIWDPRTDPRDKVVTKEIFEILRNRAIARLIAEEHVDDPQLDIENDFAVALIQDFDVALRAPRKKEHVWSINWRVANDFFGTKNEKNEWAVTRNDGYAVGYSGWGLFTKVNGALKPFHLAATRDEMIGASPYYYVLAVGDLDGDGIDELIVRRMEFEAEEDNLELWSWERGGPVTMDNP